MMKGHVRLVRLCTDCAQSKSLMWGPPNPLLGLQEVDILADMMDHNFVWSSYATWASPCGEISRRSQASPNAEPLPVDRASHPIYKKDPKHPAAEAELIVFYSRSEEEVDMDKVTAAMVLTSLSTSPLVRSPPVKVSEGLSGSWKDNGSAGPFTPSSNSSSGGYWSWSAPSDQSNPSTPSPPLSADSFKPFRVPSVGGVGSNPPGVEDPSLDEQDGSSLLFDEPIPRKRKNSMKVMFKCLWKNCGKVLSTTAGIQRHIRTIHLGRNCDSDCSDGEEDFYYTEIKLNTDSVADGLSSLSPVSSSILSPPPPPPSPLAPLNHQPDSQRPAHPSDSKEPHPGGTTPLSRSAPSALYLIHTDHAYQARKY
ncbi:hypothetical protein CCH79_00008779 [Gambusia affinis]|uniref:C2H2-type domain-containing protein n=1 Tax=Gambusia affinis TaxID=33528 RepID=A0A315UWM0_GAMAF|nr:hypothetical protein CCH79_00008779 [Gambusia affinis]